MLAELVTKPDGDPVLAPTTDHRPALPVDARSEFVDLLTAPVASSPIEPDTLKT